jgi:hypothetical protein
VLGGERLERALVDRAALLDVGEEGADGCFKDDAQFSSLPSLFGLTGEASAQA